jgi:ribose-phosphate pyrophosphokinase
MISSKELSFTTFFFPSGEPHVRLDEFEPGARFNVEYRPTHSSGLTEELFTLALLVDAARQEGMVPHRLTIGYCPFGRQDRVAVKGDALSLRVFANFINDLMFQEVVLEDPHSDVAPALILGCTVIPQYKLFEPAFDTQIRPFFLVCPDAGALKKTYQVAASEPALCEGVIECSKRRNVVTGDITGVKVGAFYTAGWDSMAYDAIIVDDICDGGRTFVTIAEQIRDCFQTVKLFVSHGVFSKGLGVFEGLIDHIYANGAWVK